MPPPSRLDRLSALLEGLAPRMTVTRPEDGVRRCPIPAQAEPALHLYLLTQGCVSLEAPASPTLILDGPCIAVYRADQAHTLTTSTAGDFGSLMCVRACLEGPVATLLLSEFSEPVIVALDNAEPALHHAVRLIGAELVEPRCGQPALLERAGDILFIGLLRHLIARPQTAGGLLNGLADPRIARALVALHTHPNHRWPLERLAEEAGMSRTAFATTFRTLMRQPPGRYLSNLRLAIARRAVRTGKGLKSAASDAGYASPSALSRALSRSLSGD